MINTVSGTSCRFRRSAHVCRIPRAQLHLISFHASIGLQNLLQTRSLVANEFYAMLLRRCGNVEHGRVVEKIGIARLDLGLQAGSRGKVQREDMLPAAVFGDRERAAPARDPHPRPLSQSGEGIRIQTRSSRGLAVWSPWFCTSTKTSHFVGSALLRRAVKRVIARLPAAVPTRSTSTPLVLPRFAASFAAGVGNQHDPRRESGISCLRRARISRPASRPNRSPAARPSPARNRPPP